MMLSKKVQGLHPSATIGLNQKVRQLKSQGEDVISLGLGDSHFKTPDSIIEEAYQGIQSGYTRYTPIEGLSELCEAICAKLHRENKLTFAPRQIIASTGAKQSLYNAFMATLDPGDEVILPAPYWVSYPDMIHVCDGVVKIVDCPKEHHFKLHPQALEDAITPRTKWVLLNSPNNPTGAVYSQTDYQALGKVLEAHPHVHILTDDIYEHIMYDGKAFINILEACPELSERTLIINGVSKGFSMSGWRLGYAAGPEYLIQAMKKIQSQTTSCASSVTQISVIKALKYGTLDTELANRRQIFQENRDYVVTTLNKTPGLSVLPPQGSFYAYVHCQGVIGKVTSMGQTIQTDTDFAQYILETAKVALIPGIAFGHSPYVRLSFSVEKEILIEAMNRIQHALSELS